VKEEVPGPRLERLQSFSNTLDLIPGSPLGVTEIVWVFAGVGGKVAAVFADPSRDLGDYGKLEDLQGSTIVLGLVEEVLLGEGAVWKASWPI